MEPPLRLRPSPAEAGGAGGVRLVAGPDEMRDWEAQVARRRLARRRGAQLGLVAVSHNVIWAGSLIAAGGLL